VTTGESRAVAATLGIVTIGQTPRPDLVQTFSAAAPGARVTIDGALDGLADDHIAGLAVPGSYPLLVRLRSGTNAEIPRDCLVPLIEESARRLVSDGATLVVLACAGEFPPLACAVPLVVPGRVLPAVVRALAAGKRIGVVTPNAAQLPFAGDKWRRDGFDAVVADASPVRHDQLAATATAMRDADVALVVLDCMGHDAAYRDEFTRISGRPTIAAQTLVAEIAGALL
jgi:protein AroM